MNYNRNFIFTKKNENIIIENNLYYNISLNISTKIDNYYECNELEVRKILIDDINKKYNCNLNMHTIQGFSNNMLRELLVFKEHYYIVELNKLKYQNSF